MESTEFLSENDKQSFEDQLLETTKITFTDMVNDGLADKKLISSDPDFNFSSSRQSVILAKWSGEGKTLVSKSLICLIFVKLFV